MRLKLPLLGLLLLATILPLRAEFLAGSALTDITPKELPVIVNGGMVSRSVDKINTPISARSLAFSDGTEKIVIVVVDTCMMPRDLLDKAKGIAAGKAGMPASNILISATHAHSAPSCMGALGTDPDPGYVLFLAKKLVEAILAPLQTMKPAKIGWGEIDAGDYTALRRWVIHPDRVREDPFGNLTVQANMHAAGKPEEVTGPSGPEDPILNMISVQSVDGEPIGLLANFSMHYFGDKDISADYFGLFSNALQDKIAKGKPGFVAMMSHGCSGDIWRRDYAKPADDPITKITLEDYTAQMTDLAMKAYEAIEYETPGSLAMKEKRLNLKYRVPDKQRLEWAEKVMAEVGDRPVKASNEIYAREQIFLHEKQQTEVVVQGLRLGDHIGIATTPCETYAITGLKIKTASPTKHTMVIELANGGDGYIPPPEQHLLGGYNTWAARSAGLEVTAEPKITEAAKGLLEAVTGKPREDRRATPGPAVLETLALKPRAYWRLDEFTGPRAVDSSPNGLDAIYEPRVLFYLSGPNDSAFSSGGINRSAHFAGDRLSARIPGLTGRNYTVSLWFWSGTSDELLTAPEWIFSRGIDHETGIHGEQVGIAMNSAGKRILVYEDSGSKQELAGTDTLERWTWNHLVIAREGITGHVFLNGKHIIATKNGDLPETSPDTFFFGGSAGEGRNFEGRLDEIAVFDRPVSSEELIQLFQTSSEN
jgi:hypothetical protein